MAHAKNALGDLDRIVRVIKVVGFVASAEGFTDQGVVMNGCSDLLIQIFGESGRHARRYGMIYSLMKLIIISSVGVMELPASAPVEVEMVLEISP